MSQAEDNDRQSLHGWLDISVPVRQGMAVWPGDPDITVERVCSIDDGDEVNVTRLAMSAHTGTHMDAPLHFLRDGMGIDQMPVEATVGPARVLEIGHPVAVSAEELTWHDIQPGERILLKTRNSSRLSYMEPFATDYTYVAPDAAAYLAERRVRCVGVDYLSVGGYDARNRETHVTLLEAGIWIIEGLDLSRVSPGIVELLCLPLRIEGADGAPARAFVRM